MFGIIRPCRHRLPDALRTSWMAHLCGLCLALRDDHGQLARTTTNYDGLILSVLVEAQARHDPAAGRRTAGPCPLRGMRTAEVARGAGARLAATVSLALAAAKVRDHVADRDGAFAVRPVAAGARVVADRWSRQSAGGGTSLHFDTDVLVAAVARQADLERTAGPGTTLLDITEPTETATAAAFAHTAALAARPGNAAALAEAGRLFGRLAHLLDAVEDQQTDERRGAWNPLTATATSRDEAERLCRDAVHGIRLALSDVEFTDRALVHVLLAHETGRAVDRVFGTRTGSCRVAGPSAAPSAGPSSQGVAPHEPSAPPPPSSSPPHEPGRPPRGVLAGLGMAGFLCCTGQVCCNSGYEGPWSRRKREGLCSQADCDCCDCCDCCDSGDGGCCDACDGGCCGCCDCCGCDC